jgi:drug/metabolite transporter (DMT)-like permease
MERPAKIKAVISMLFVMLVWGSSFAVTKDQVTHIPPVCYAFLRFGIASVCLLCMSMFRSRHNPEKRVPLPVAPLFWMGFSGVGCFYVFFNYSLVYTTASMGALLQAFIPAVIAVLAWFVLKETVRPLQAVSILISVAGVVLVAFVGQSGSTAPKPVLGNVLMLISVCSWGVYTIISKKLAGYDALSVTCYSSIIGTALLIPGVVVELWHKPWPPISLGAWVSLLYLGALGSAVCYLLYNKALNDLPASAVGIFINLDPIIGAAIAVVFLHERIFFWQVVGALLVLLGMWLSSKSARHER